MLTATLSQKLEHSQRLPIRLLTSCEDLIGAIHERHFIYLARSIEYFDAPLPLLIDDSLAIVSGNARFQIMHYTSHTVVPVIHQSELTRREILAIKVAEGELIGNPFWSDEFIETVMLSMAGRALAQVN